MGIFDDPFDRDHDGKLDYAEKAGRDYFFFDDDAYGGSGNSDDSYSSSGSGNSDDSFSSGGSGNSGRFYSSSGSGYRKSASGGSSAGRIDDEQKAYEELLKEYAQKVAQKAARKAERKAARKEKSETFRKEILIASGISAILIAACVVFIIFSVINRQNRYVEEAAGYYASSNKTDTEEEFLAKTIIITDRKNISFDGRQWKVTKIRKDGTQIWIKALDGSFCTCVLDFFQNSGYDDRIYIITLNYDEECDGHFYYYYTESEYSAALEALSSENAE